MWQGCRVAGLQGGRVAGRLEIRDWKLEKALRAVGLVRGAFFVGGEIDLSCLSC